MGSCIYCGRPAGFLRSAHRECADQNVAARSGIKALLSDALTDMRTDIDATARQVLALAARGGVNEKDIQEAAKSAFQDFVEHVLDDGLLSAAEETRAVSIMRAFALPSSTPGHGRLVKAGILRDLDEGRAEPRVEIEDVPISLKRGEVLLWCFQEVQLGEMRSQSHYVGGSRGVSFRVAKGVYCRVGAFKGQRVSTSSLQMTGEGSLFITNRALSFVGDKTLKVALNKIISVDPRAEGIIVHREQANPKPLVFMVDDPWFATNLILKASSL